MGTLFINGHGSSGSAHTAGQALGDAPQLINSSAKASWTDNHWIFNVYRKIKENRETKSPLLFLKNKYLIA